MSRLTPMAQRVKYWYDIAGTAAERSIAAKESIWVVAQHPSHLVREAWVEPIAVLFGEDPASVVAFMGACRAYMADRLSTMPYKAYLATPEWQETRTAALKRATHKCQLCGATARLNVHHNTYERRGHELDSDLIVLCEGCHMKHHGKIRVAS